MSYVRRCSICGEPIGVPGVFQKDKRGRVFHPSCGYRAHLEPVAEFQVGKNGRILKGGYGRAKVHYGMVGPVCNSSLPGGRRETISHVLTTDPKQVTCKHCKKMIDLRDTKHVLHLKKNLKKG